MTSNVNLDASNFFFCVVSRKITNGIVSKFTFEVISYYQGRSQWGGGGAGGQTAPPDTKNREGEKKIGKGRKRKRKGKRGEKRKRKEEKGRKEEKRERKGKKRRGKRKGRKREKKEERKDN